MAGIQPTSSVGPIGPQPAARPAARGGQPAKTAFGDTLRSVIDKVNADQHASASAIRDMIAGKTQDVLPVVQAVAKADLSFKLLLGVRNKVIEAYKQTMNMPV